jgi:hypothetical protein
MKEILSYLNDKTYHWHICSDMKVFSFLMGLQKGHAKFYCFPCRWGSCHARSVYYSKKNWPQLESHKPGAKNVAHQLPPRHNKLGLMKSFLKTLDRSGPAFSFLHEKFPRFSLEKIKAALFIGHQMFHLFIDPQLHLIFSDDEKAA